MTRDEILEAIQLEAGRYSMGQVLCNAAYKSLLRLETEYTAMPVEMQNNPGVRYLVSQELTRIGALTKTAMGKQKSKRNELIRALILNPELMGEKPEVLAHKDEFDTSVTTVKLAMKAAREYGDDYRRNRIWLEFQDFVSSLKRERQ